MQIKIVLLLILIPFLIFGQNSEDLIFEKLESDSKWQLKMSDDGKGHWQTNWFLDGEIAKVENSEKGMHLQAGPEFGNDAHHMVLWTKQSFQGDVKIEFDYTRTDNETRAVNILYIQATGKEEGEFTKDISEWNNLRTVPSMRTYFNNMKTLHISFAAFPNDEETQDYIRVRRYPVLPEKSFRELEVKPTFFDTGLFKTGETYQITVIKTDERLFFKVIGKDNSKLYSWNTSHLPPLKEGRIGLRHMYTRSALYENFKVFEK
ncbi:MAG: YesU family protein [Bacteroidales bacterium]|nr:YesU family protein [Bacteroidales bacterium]